MARSVVLTDDLDGTPATRTIKFSVEGTSYEIDLSDENQARLQAALHDFVAGARVTRAARKPEEPPAEPEEIVNQIEYPGKPKPKPTNPQLRQWARENGISVNPTGRIPASVRDAYLAAS